MFPSFIGINEKILNLNSIALIEDKSTGERPEDAVAVVTTNEGTEIELVAEDATLLFERAELLTFASDAIFSDLQRQFESAGQTSGDGA